jgi:hypothetical protein
MFERFVMPHQRHPRNVEEYTPALLLKKAKQVLLSPIHRREPSKKSFSFGYNGPRKGRFVGR